MLLFVTSALAAPLLPSWTVGEHRSVKIDLFSYAYGHHPFGADWIPTRLDQWTVVVDCETVAQRVEKCSFLEAPWWSYVPEQSSEMQLHSLPVPPTFEITWTKTGRVGSFDPAVDPGPFGDAIADLQLVASYHRKDVIWKPDAKRKIGYDIWLALVRDLSAALELEGPKTGIDGPFEPMRAPTLTRRYVQGTAKAALVVATEPAIEGVLPLTLSGRVSEAPPDGGAAVETRVQARIGLSETHGRPVVARWDLASSSSSQVLVGHTRRMVLMQPYAFGDDPKPSPMPEPYPFP